MPDTSRSEELAELLKSLKSSGVRYAQIETPDINGTLRGKLVSIEKALSPAGGAFCTILYGLTPRDDVYESRFSSFSNGFPDAFAVADPTTCAILDPDRGIAAVVCDMAEADRQSYYPLSPRTALRRVDAAATALGFEARFAIELEVFVVETDRALITSGAPQEQASFGRLHNAYSLARMDELRPVAALFMDRMQAMGIGIEAIHTELGHGLLEIALAHRPALEAADACARVKLYLKEVFANRGYSTIFMPKWRYEESGCGGHIHQSLWRDGEAAFAGPDGAFSDIGRRYLAGQLATLRDFSAIFYPTINAYRRMDAGAWAPENVSWGLDNRTCALRVITQPTTAAYRIEHRCPGADVNPYLAIACMLAGGLMGIESGVEAPEPVAGNAGERGDLARLPSSLEEAVSLLQASEVAADMLGPELVEQYVISRQEECRLWRDWQAQTISDWELSRYFDLH